MATERQVGTRSMHSQRSVLHPPFTHFPIALWSAAFLFDILSLWAGNLMVRAAFYNVALGTAMAVLTGATGVLDYNKLARNDPARRVGLQHAFLMVGILVLFAFNTWLHMVTRTAITAPVFNVVITGIGLCALVVGGYLGHKLVMDYGANVYRLAEHEREHVPTAPDRSSEIGRTPIRPNP